MGLRHKTLTTELGVGAKIGATEWNDDHEVVDDLLFPARATNPAVPAAGTGVLYAQNVAGRLVPKWMGPSGVDYLLQPHIGLNNVAAWRGGSTTTAATFASQVGSMPYSAASGTTPTIPTLAATSLRNSTYRSTIATSTTAGNVAFIRANFARIWRGDAAGLGGFFYATRFSLSGTLRAGLRCFVGIQDSTASPTNVDPLSNGTIGRVGIAINSETGNWSFVHNIAGTAPTVIALGANFPVNNTDLYEVALFCAPNGSSISYRVVNWSTNQTTTGSISTNIPAATTFMVAVLWVTNNATAASQAIDFISTYVETDY